MARRVELLLTKGTKVNHTAKHRCVVLHKAVKYGQEAVVDLLLLTKGAVIKPSPKLKDKAGKRHYL